MLARLRNISITVLLAALSLISTEAPSFAAGTYPSAPATQGAACNIYADDTNDQLHALCSYTDLGTGTDRIGSIKWRIPSISSYVVCTTGASPWTGSGQGDCVADYSQYESCCAVVLAGQSATTGISGYACWDTGTSCSSTSTAAGTQPVTIDTAIYGDYNADTSAPTPPATVTATAAGADVTVTWSGATDDTGVTGYRVRVDGGTWHTTASAPYVDTGAASASHTYDVQAGDAAGNWSPSATASYTYVTPPPDPLQGHGDDIWSQLGSNLHHPVAVLGLALAAASIAIGLVLKWVRKAVHA